VLVDGLLVEGVEHSHLGGTAICFDVVSDRFEILAGATYEEYARSLTGELPGDRAADGSSPAVDDSVLVY
jgi:hypothetical protein